MIGLDANTPQQEEYEDAPQGIAAALQTLLGRFSRELKDLEFDSTLPAPQQSIIAKVEAEDCTYFLIRCKKLAVESLSEQQMKIARLVSEGFSNKQIGRKLGIKPGTVASHIGQVYNKLNITSRAALVRCGFLIT